MTQTTLPSELKHQIKLQVQFTMGNVSLEDALANMENFISHQLHLKDLEKAEAVREEQERTEYAEKLLDDVVCLYVKNLQDDTSLMKRVRELMKKRIDEGKAITVAWGWLDDRGLLVSKSLSQTEGVAPQKEEGV